MSQNCIDCSLPFRPRQEVVTCIQCKRQQHRTCTPVTRPQYRQALREKTQLQHCCTQCSLLPTAESTRLDTTDVTLPYTHDTTRLVPNITEPSESTSRSPDDDDATLPYSETTRHTNSSFDITNREAVPLPEQIAEEYVYLSVKFGIQNRI